MSERITLSPDVQPIYENIASADFYQLRQLERFTLPRTLGLDTAERSLLLKAIVLRRKKLLSEKKIESSCLGVFVVKNL